MGIIMDQKIRENNAMVEVTLLPRPPPLGPIIFGTPRPAVQWKTHGQQDMQRRREELKDLGRKARGPGFGFLDSRWPSIGCSVVGMVDNSKPVYVGANEINEGM